MVDGASSRDGAPPPEEPVVYDLAFTRPWRLNVPMVVGGLLIVVGAAMVLLDVLSTTGILGEGSLRSWTSDSTFRAGLRTFGVGALVLLVGRPADHSLMIDRSGMRMNVADGVPWNVTWWELHAVAVSRAAGARARTAVRRRSVVRLDLYPVDAEFHRHHLEMAPFRAPELGTHAYRVELGRERRPGGRLEEAVRRLGPGIHLDATDGDPAS